MRLSIEDLRAFVTAADVGSLGRAAALLEVTQSALSKRLRHLEDAAGVELLERSTTGVRPTSAGEEVLAEARRAVAQVDALGARFATLRVTPNLVRVASTPALAERVVPAAIAMLEPGDTAVPVELLVANSAMVRQAFADGRADVAVFGADIDDPVGPPARRLADDELVVVLRDDDPWASRTAIPAALLAERPLVLRDPASHVRRTLDRRLRQAGITLRPPVLEAGNPAAVKAAVRAQHAPGILSRFAVDAADPGLVVRRVEDADLRRAYWVSVATGSTPGAAQIAARLAASLAARPS